MCCCGGSLYIHTVMADGRATFGFKALAARVVKQSASEYTLVGPQTSFHIRHYGSLISGKPSQRCVCESYIGKPIGTRAVPQFTRGVAKPLTQPAPSRM